MQPQQRYELLEKIASGSFATVYRGRDLELGREVAIKQIHEQYLQDPRQLDRFWQEAQLLASFQHPNIVTIYDLVRDRGWLVLELMQSDLSKVAGRRQMDLGALRTTLAHCLRALKFLHSHGIVHGDVKPSNMMIDRRRRVKLGDFGLARRVSDEDGSLIKGTTRYMAPEVVSDEFGEVGPASDLYSLGFAAYELMCGENFESLFPGLGAFGRDRQMAWMMWHAAPDRRLPEIRRVLEDVPDDLARTIQKLTAKSQSDRYQSADQALSDLNIDLKLVKTGEESVEGLAGPVKSADTQRRRLVIAAFVASVVLSAVVLFLPQGGNSTPPDRLAPRSGVVREVLAERQILVIEDEKGHPEEVSLGSKPRIRLDGDRFILLREVQKLDRVEIRDDPDDDQPAQVAVLRPVQGAGQLKSVDPAAHQIVVALTSQIPPRDMSMAVPETAKVLLNGQAAGLAELQPDDRVDVLFVRSGRAAVECDALRLEARRSVRLTGFVRQVRSYSDRLWLVVEKFGSEKHIEFADDCEISIEGARGQEGAFTPEDLKPSDRVVVTHDTQITRVEAVRRARLSGAVMRIDQAARKLTVRGGDGREVALEVAADCEIQIDDQPAELSDLRRFDKVDVTHDGDEGAPSARTVDARHPKER